MTVTSSSIRSDGDRRAFLARGLLFKATPSGGEGRKTRTAQSREKDKEDPT